jgi:hypothetical protein
MPSSQPTTLPIEPYIAPDGFISWHELAHLAFNVANQSVISEIETEGIAVDFDGRRWYDTRSMTDPQRHCPEVIAMARQSINFAVASQLVGLHPQHPYLLHILNRA